MAGARCSVCGREEFLPFRCKLCAQPHCLEHRLPENHRCQGLGEYRARVREERVFAVPEGGVPVRVRAPSPARETLSRASRWFRRSTTHRLLGLFLLVYAAQWIGAIAYSVAAGAPLGQGIHVMTCLLGAGSGPCGGPEGVASFAAKPWTLLTANFAHHPTNPFHLIFNGIFLYFVGSMIEPRIGGRRTLELFLVCGVLATVMQVGLFPWSLVVGASGGLMGVLGTLTILSPTLQVLFFFVPMPLWVLTSIFVVIDLLGFGAPNVAHTAHLAGLAVGVAYGYRLRRRGVLPKLASSWAFQRRG